MIRAIIEYSQRGRSGPFARFLAKDAQVCAAMNAASRVSSDFSGRTELRVMPSGVFFPTVDNIILTDEPDEALLQADSLALQSKGYGPIKLRSIKPDQLNLADFADRDVLMEGQLSSDFSEQADEICLVLSEADLTQPLPDWVTSLAVYDVTDPDRLSALSLPVTMYTLKKFPMKVRTL